MSARSAAGRAWTCGLALLLLLGGCSDAGDDLEASPRIEAPAFDLPLLVDGRPVKLEDQRGKVVILDFWATWCAPCEIQMPVLDAIWKTADHDKLMIIGLSVDQDPADVVAAWVKKRGFSYPIALGDSDLAMRYGVVGYPTLMLIDPQGGIAKRHTGVWSRPEIEDVVEAIRRQAAPKN